MIEIDGSHGEIVAEEAAHEAQDYLAHSAPAGPYLADQLLLPVALGGISEFVTSEPTLHF